MRSDGFTLIELLVGMVLVSVLLAALMAVQNTVLQNSGREQSKSERSATITDVSGYLGDRIKTAVYVPDGLTIRVPVGSTVQSVSCQRQPSSAADLPCLAVVLPVVGADGALGGWKLHAYRYVDRTTVLSAQEQTPGLGGLTVDGRAAALREERVDSSCGTALPALTALATCFAATAQANLIVDGLVVPSDGAGTFGFEPATGLVTLGLRSFGRERGAVAYLPVTGVYQLRIYARNTVK